MSPHSSSRWAILGVFCAFTILVLIPAPGQTVAAPFDKDFEITPDQKWTDTKIDLRPGDLISFSASTTGAAESPCDPQGTASLANGGKLPLPTVPPGALIAKLAQNSDAAVFVGAARELRISEAGRLYLGSNISAPASCHGKYAVTIHVVPGGATESSTVQSKLAAAAQVFMNGQFGGTRTATGSPRSPAIASDASQSTAVPATSAAPSGPEPKPLTISSAPLDPQLERDLQALPRRVNDEFKNPGDMTNFVLVGSEKLVQEALTSANWHLADTSTPGAVTRAILMATQKQDYLQMPMSQLYLFGRVQDFGYEQAEPYSVVASRHHFRLWKAPLTYQDQPLWIGAGTHDIGFEKDQRNGKVTHKIDPAVDGERDHIGDSLQQAGRARLMNYFTPSDQVQEARNATGGGYHSDGRVLVIFLQ
jgi:hypothetical protein